jgi:hypothetical protein
MKKKTPEELQLLIHKHLQKMILLMVEGEEPTREDELDAEDFASLVIGTLGLKVGEEQSDGSIACLISLGFIDSNLVNQTPE